MVNRGQVNKDEKLRLIDRMQLDMQKLQQQNEQRVQELASQGMGVSPVTVLAAQVQVLMDWQCPGEYQRARFELETQQKINEMLFGEGVEQAQAQITQKMAEAEEFERQKQIAETGRTESGLFVPKTVEEVVEVNTAATADEGVHPPIRIG